VNTLRFVARQRGRKIIIKGKVPVSFLEKGPFLNAVPEA